MLVIVLCENINSAMGNHMALLTLAQNDGRLVKLLLFSSCPCHVACRILALQSGIEPMSPGVEVES